MTERGPGVVTDPSEDRHRSPFTGWTRAHWIATADQMLEGVRRYASPRHASIRIPGQHGSSAGSRSDGLEGYARTFLLAAYRLAASQGHAPGDLVDRYSVGLQNGTDPRSDEAWPVIGHRGQPIVEAAFVALALAESRPWIWDGLDDATRQRVVDWLSGVRGKRTPPNNWVLFPVVVEAFLKSVGAPHSQDVIERNLDLVDSWYRRDGWYSDGAGEHFDYYSGWGIHFSTLMWSRLDPSDESRAAVYRERLFRFLDQYRYLFGANGAPVYHGRSLTYRFATVTPFWLGALVDSTPLGPGETRRLASGVLRHFLDRGALRDGVMTLGWYDEFLPMIQHYSGHGSPYWASKGFCGLLLPEDHPVWTATEEPMAVEQADFCTAMPAPGFLVQGTTTDGVVRLASHRSDHYPLPVPQEHTTRARQVTRRVARRFGSTPTSRGPSYDAHYAKLAYSTHTAPDVDDDVDSQVTVVLGSGERSRRLRFTCLGVADRFAASVYHPHEHVNAGRIETATISHGRFAVRVHHVTVPGGQDLRDGGYSVASDTPLEAGADDEWATVRRGDGLTSSVHGLRGFDGAGIHHGDGRNAYGALAATPYLTASGTVAPESVFVSLVVLGVAESACEDARVLVAGLEVSGRQVVFCLDGEWWFLQMVEPERVERSLGGRTISGAVKVARVSPDGTVFSLDADGRATP